MKHFSATKHQYNNAKFKHGKSPNRTPNRSQNRGKHNLIDRQIVVNKSRSPNSAKYKQINETHTKVSPGLEKPHCLLKISLQRHRRVHKDLETSHPLLCRILFDLYLYFHSGGGIQDCDILRRRHRAKRSWHDGWTLEIQERFRSSLRKGHCFDRRAKASGLR